MILCLQTCNIFFTILTVSTRSCLLMHRKIKGNWRKFSWHPTVTSSHLCPLCICYLWPSMVIQVCSSVRPRFPSCPSFHSSSLLRNIPQSVFCISCASWIFSFHKIIEVSIQSSLNFLSHQKEASEISSLDHTYASMMSKIISPEFLGFLFQCSCFLLILTLLPDSYLKGKSQKYHHIWSKSSIWLN